jgi:hypothetical protein
MTAIFFVAMVTGLTLELHLYTHKNEDNHTSSQCSICQTLLSNTNKTSITAEPKIEKTNETEYSAVFVCQITPLFSNIKLPIPRSPPFGL